MKLKEETENPIIRDSYFNNPLSIMERITRHKINKEIETLDKIINHVNLIDTENTVSNNRIYILPKCT